MTAILTDLQDRLHRFFDLQPRFQRESLAQFVLGLTRLDLSEVGGDWGQQRQLTAAATRTVLSPLLALDTDEAVATWTGGWTLCWLSKNGTLLGLASNVKGRVYDVYGPSLETYALAKAVLTLFLAHDRKDGNLSSPANLRYLRQLGVNRPFVGSNYSRLFYTALGASGCEIPWQQRRKRYFPGLNPESPKHEVNAAAGQLNEVFAGHTHATLHQITEQCYETPALCALATGH